MSVRGLILLLAFQLAGTALSLWLLPALPGPILGMLLALAWLGLDGIVTPHAAWHTSGTRRPAPAGWGRARGS